MFTTRVPLSVIVWDFDGVLNANAPRGRHIWSENFEADFGQPLARFAQAVFGEGSRQVLTGAVRIEDRIADWISSTDADTTPETVLRYWLDRDLHPDPKVLDLSAKVAKRGFQQVILSNADLARADWIEAQIDRFPHVSRVFASSRMGLAKPDPEVFRAVAGAMDVPPGALMLIDDNGTNVNAAAGVGYRTFRYSALAHDALVRSLMAERV